MLLLSDMKAQVLTSEDVKLSSWTENIIYHYLEQPSTPHLSSVVSH